MRIRCR